MTPDKEETASRYMVSSGNDNVGIMDMKRDREVVATVFFQEDGEITANLYSRDKSVRTFILENFNIKKRNLHRVPKFFSKLV